MMLKKLFLLFLLINISPLSSAYRYDRQEHLVCQDSQFVAKINFVYSGFNNKPRYKRAVSEALQTLGPGADQTFLFTGKGLDGQVWTPEEASSIKNVTHQESNEENLRAFIKQYNEYVEKLISKDKFKDFKNALNWPFDSFDSIPENEKEKYYTEARQLIKVEGFFSNHGAKETPVVAQNADSPLEEEELRQLHRENSSGYALIGGKIPFQKLASQTPASSQEANASTALQESELHTVSDDLLYQIGREAFQNSPSHFINGACYGHDLTASILEGQKNALPNESSKPENYKQCFCSTALAKKGRVSQSTNGSDAWENTALKAQEGNIPSFLQVSARASSESYLGLFNVGATDSERIVGEYFHRLIDQNKNAESLFPNINDYGVLEEQGIQKIQQILSNKDQNFSDLSSEIQELLDASTAERIQGISHLPNISLAPPKPGENISKYISTRSDDILKSAEQSIINWKEPEELGPYLSELLKAAEDAEKLLEAETLELILSGNNDADSPQNTRITSYQSIVNQIQIDIEKVNQLRNNPIQVQGWDVLNSLKHLTSQLKKHFTALNQWYADEQNQKLFPDKTQDKLFSTISRIASDFTEHQNITNSKLIKMLEPLRKKVLAQTFLARSKLEKLFLQNAPKHLKDKFLKKRRCELMEFGPTPISHASENSSSSSLQKHPKDEAFEN